MESERSDWQWLGPEPLEELEPEPEETKKE
jgi:hypothetical protein